MPVSTLAALAQGAVRIREGRSVLVAIDARMQEVYWGCYQVGAEALVEPLAAEAALAPEAVTAPGAGPWLAVGSGWACYAPQLVAAVRTPPVEIIRDFYPHGQDLAVLGARLMREGRWITPDQALPVYLRDKVAN